MGSMDADTNILTKSDGGARGLFGGGATPRIQM